MKWSAAFAFAVALGAILAGAGCSTVDHVDFFPDDGGALAADGAPLGTGDGGGLPDGAACVPNNAADCAGYCGSIVGRCGKIIECGSCPAGLNCGGAGPNLCGTGTCTPSCSGKACGATDGCGGTCMTGTCGGGQHCDGGACVCDPTSCAGCCSGSTCLGGSSSSACGKGGSICASCSGGGGCSGGLCTGCTPSCSGKSCGASDGCGGTCTTGACSTGQRCSAGTCVCDTTSCSGCCSGSSCLAGTTATSCGAGGNACVSCNGTQTCSGGACHAQGPFLAPCNVLLFSGCAQICQSAGGTCVAKCGPSGNAGAESFTDSACSAGGVWEAGDQCGTTTTAYGRCCCQ